MWSREGHSANIGNINKTFYFLLCGTPNPLTLLLYSKSPNNNTWHSLLNGLFGSTNDVSLRRDKQWPKEGVWKIYYFCSFRDFWWQWDYNTPHFKNIYCTHYFLFFLWQSAMDAARLSAAKSSPMMETINMVRHHYYTPSLWRIRIKR